jgi:hypothetical protein
MKFPSFMRLFGGRDQRASSKRERRPKSSLRAGALRPRLMVEDLEPRLVPSGAVPTIVKVTPADGSISLSSQPQITVTFSEAMLVPTVTNPANYEIFGSSGNAIPVTSVSYSPVTLTATLSYTGNATGGSLTADKYTLFVRGDQLVATDGEPIAPPGQIAVVSAGSSTASLVNMPGDGSLQAISNYFAGTNNAPDAVTLADVTGDGIPDLVAANFQSDTVSIFNGLPGGRFSPAATETLSLPAGGVAPQGIVAGDFTGSGAIDLATANVGSGNITVFLNNGQGKFPTATNFTATAAPDAITTADLDNSGHLDLITANSDGTINVFVNNGTGGFGAPISVATGLTTLTGVAAGNLSANPAHAPDVVVSAANGVAELVNTTSQPGQITFAAPVQLDTTDTTSIAVGKLSNSNLNDVAATTATNGGEVLVYRNTAGRFSNGVPTPSNASPMGVHIGDINGDGRNDLIVANNNAFGGTVSVMLNVSGTSFASPVTAAVDNSPLALATTSDAKGVVTLIATANDTSNDLSTVRVANGQLLASTDISLAGTSLGQPVTGDLNDDHVPSIVIPNPQNNTVTVLLSNPSGSGYLPASTVAVGNGPVSVSLGNLFGRHYADGQPILDMVVANQGDNTISILENNGQGVFTVPQAPIANTLGVGKSPNAVLVGDFTGNGVMDIAVAHSLLFSLSNDSGVTFFLGNGNGTFRTPTELVAGTQAVDLAAADFNQDGKLDLAVLAGQFNSFTSFNLQGTVTLLYGNGDGTFQTSPADVFQTGENSTSLAVGDLNRDGLPDLVVTDHTTVATGNQTAYLAVLLNTPGIGFGSFIRTDVVSSPDATLQSVAVVSTGQDAFPDVITTFGDLSGSADVVNNVAVLPGLGNGHFNAPQLYATDGGGPIQTPTFFATVSDPFLRVSTFTTLTAIVSSNLIQNGTFEMPDLSNETGSLTGWQTAAETNSHGNWLVQTGSFSPTGNVEVSPAPQGQYAAVLDQPDLSLPYTSQLGEYYTGTRAPQSTDYDGTHILYQDVTIPATATKVTLTYSLYLNDTNNLGYTDPNITPQLDYFPNIPPSMRSPNQQVRVDIVNPAADIYSVTNGPNGVLMNVFETRTGDPLVLGYVTNPTTGDPTVSATIDLTQFAGQTIRLRVAEVNNRGRMIVGVDNVQVTAIFPDNTKPTINGLRLRNPGVGATTTFGGDTTDPTIIGQVNDAGTVNNIVNITVDPTGTNTFTGSSAIPVRLIDAQGNFQITLPSTMLPGMHTIDIQAEDRAGNVVVAPFTFTLQGPSLTTWQAMGPGPIQYNGKGVDYKSVAGDITSIATDPQDPSGNTIYVGTDNGGVWKTTDGGADWTPLTDYVIDQNTGIPIAPDIGAVAVDPNNPNSVYAATGVPGTTAATTAHQGQGILKSTDGGKDWVVLGDVFDSKGVFQYNLFGGARISKISISDVNPNNPNAPIQIFVAVESGGPLTGEFGPGVYVSNDRGKTWAAALNPANMFLDNGQTLSAAGFALASATDVEIDRFSLNESTIWVGLGNVGMATPSKSAGVWKSVNDGQTWQQIVGGHDPKGGEVLHQKIPAANDGTSDVGQVLIALPGQTETLGPDGVVHPEGRVNEDGTVYVFIDNRTAVSEDEKTAQNLDRVTGVFKTTNGGLSWTHVMLRENITPFHESANDNVNAHNYEDIFFTGGGVDADVAQALVVDPTNSNVVYLGGSNRFFSERYGVEGLLQVEEGSHTLLRIDTTNMRDTNYLDPFLPGLTYPNDGDDIFKMADATVEAALKENAAKYPDGNAYKGEGVMWTDLQQQTTGFSSQDSLQMPSVVNALLFDQQGRLLVGTVGGIFRGVSQGWQYDTTQGSSLETEGFGIWSIEGDLLGNTPVEEGMTFTDINSNLQISDVTSVAIDPVDLHGIQASFANLGWAKTSGTLPWASTNDTFLNAPQGLILENLFQPDPFDGPTPYSGMIAAGPVNPAFPSNPSTIFRAYASPPVPLTTPPDELQASILGGQAGTFNPISQGLPVQPLAAFPEFAVDPNVVVTQGAPADELLFATNEVFRSDDSGITWNQISQPLVSGTDVITSLAIADVGGVNGSNVFYVGTQSGKVFVTQNDGADNWPNSSQGLPGLPVDGIVVNPQNPLNAFIAIGGTSTGLGHIFETTDGGKTWKNITGALPDVPAYSVAIDPRSTPADPIGKIWLGTQVGVYFSVDNGVTWAKYGQGLPNVPVISIQFNQTQEKLVVGTQGRGVWEINTDIHGPQVTGFSPNTPVLPGIATVTVTFSKPVDPRTFTTASVDQFTGPNGPVTALAVTDLDPINHLRFGISFVPQTTDGTYAISIGPSITDFVGDQMDQNNNGLNGEVPADEFTGQFTINTTDTGRFISGAYHSILNRVADTSGFDNFLGFVQIGNSQVLSNTATAILLSAEARGDLIYNGTITPQHPAASGLYEQLLHRGASPTEIANWINALNQGESPEQIIVSLTTTGDEYFINDAGGTDQGFVNQLFHDLLGRAADPGALNAFTSELTGSEIAARFGIANALDKSAEYQLNLVNSTFSKYLGRAATPAEQSSWVAQLQAGVTDEQFIAILVGSQEFFDNQGDDNSNFVNAAFQDILGRSADSGSLNAFVTAIQNGVSRTSVAQALLGSVEYFQLLIKNDFTLYLGRLPVQSDYDTFVPALQAGETDETMLSTILASSEFYSRNKGNATTQAQQDQNWLNAAFQAVLNRAPDAGANAAFLQELDFAEQLARAGVSQAIVGSTEYQVRQISTEYQTLLGRQPGIAEVDFWLPVLSQPSAGPGTLSRDEQLKAGILGSSEYFNLQRNNASPSLATNQQWVISLYDNILGRAPEAAGLNAFLSNLLNGFAAQRLVVATALDTSVEYYANLTTALFQQFLRRTPGPVELNQRITQLQTGSKDEDLINVLVSSNEYFENPTLGNSNNSTWLNQIYLDILGRNRDAGSDVFLTGLNNGTMTRGFVAGTLLGSQEYRTDLINRYFSLYLGRPASQADINGWLNAFASGQTDEQVIAAIISSGEYFELSHPYP